MVKRCAYGICNSDTRTLPENTDVKFIPFPKKKSNLASCLRWIKACGRTSDTKKTRHVVTPDTVTKHTYVCSKVGHKIRDMWNVLLGLRGDSCMYDKKI